MMKLLNIFSSFIFALKWVWKVDVVYVWFGGYHGFFPVLFAKIFGKKSIVIVGGYDASYVPTIGYGVFYNKGFLLWCIKRIYKWCTWICPVDESLVRSTNHYADPSGIGFHTGILNHMKLDENKIRVVHLGFDGEMFFVQEKIPNSIITVALVDDASTYKLKGIDMVLSCAEELSDYTFTIVGLSNTLMSNKNLPKNVKIIERPSYKEIRELLGSQMLQLHPSLTEGFCSVIVEGMLSGCVPIGSNVGGIKRSIGDCGYVIVEANKVEYVEAIRSALSLCGEMGYKARERANSLYTMEKRRDALLNLIM